LQKPRFLSHRLRLRILTCIKTRSEGESTEEIVFQLRLKLRGCGGALNELTRQSQITLVSACSGAGKSSLISILLRLRELQAGAILLDYKDVRIVPLHRLRDAIGVVPQAPFLFQVIESCFVFANINAWVPAQVLESAYLLRYTSRHRCLSIGGIDSQHSLVLVTYR
jgi:ABC-type transport system involved in Fe-S cluster assembly fused permease/ATPase subunit